MNLGITMLLWLLLPLVFVVAGLIVIRQRRAKHKKTKLHSDMIEASSPVEGRPRLWGGASDAASRDLPVIPDTPSDIDQIIPTPYEKSELSSLAKLPVSQLVNNRTAVLLSTYIEHVLHSGADEILVGDILHLIDTQRCTFNCKLAVDFASVIEALGYGIAPDPRIHGVEPKATDLIKIFPLTENDTIKVTDEFHRVVVLVHLTSMVSKADEIILESEKQLTRAVIHSNKSFTPFERASLHALFDWSFSNSFGYRGIKRNIEKLNHSEKLSVWEHLVKVAIVDNNLDVRELAELQVIYDVLGLDPSKKHIYLAAVSNAILAAKRVQLDVSEFDKTALHSHSRQIENSTYGNLASDNGAQDVTSPVEALGEVCINFEQNIEFEIEGEGEGEDEDSVGLHEIVGRSWAGKFYVVDHTIHTLDRAETLDNEDWFDTAIGK